MLRLPTSPSTTHRGSTARSTISTPLAVSAFALTSLTAPLVRGAPSWVGDFETGTLGQWSYQLNPEGLSVVQEPTLNGQHAGRVAITGENLWDNGLNRVELQRKPSAELTADGSRVFFGWSVYLPQALTGDEHQLGYWETDQTYRQVMSLRAEGQDLYFRTERPGRVWWRGPGWLTPGVWHRFVFAVSWASQTDAGRVSLWVDGRQVLDEIAATTYLGDPAFIQLGILRDTIDQEEVLFIDDALEGSSYEDVALLDSIPALPEPPASEYPMPRPIATQPAAVSSPSTATQPKSGSDDGGCTMALTPGGSPLGDESPAWVLVLGALAIAVRRVHVRLC